MSSNYQWLLSGLVGLMVSLVSLPSQAQAQLGQGYDPSKFVTVEEFERYEEHLNALLKTRFDEEKEFVGEVVDRVRLNKIPAKLVQTSYGWVRNRRPNTNYPFIYFERVLRLQAKKVGIEKAVPDFDYNVYREFRAPIR